MHATADNYRKLVGFLLAATAVAILLIFILPILIGRALQPTSSTSAQQDFAKTLVRGTLSSELGKQPLLKPQALPPKFLNELRSTAIE